jgi:hypothetical protein
MELALEDHFGASRSLVELAGRVMVLVYAERRGASAARFWLILAISILAGIAVLLSKPTGRKPSSSVPWRGQIKPPPPPPIPPGPRES